MILKRLIVRSLVYAVSAAIAPLVILGFPRDFGSLGMFSPYLTAVQAAVSAVLSIFLLTYYDLWPRFKNIFVQGVCCGLMVVIISHPAYGILSYIYSLCCEPALFAKMISFGDFFWAISFHITLIFTWHVMIPVAFLSGIISEYLVKKIDPNLGLESKFDTDR